MYSPKFGGFFMTVHFASLNDVREFVSLATLQPYGVQVVDGEHSVNAKSFMEMFTLDFSNALAVLVDSAADEERFAQAAKKFLA